MSDTTYLFVKLLMGKTPLAEFLGGIQNNLTLGLLNLIEVHWVDLQPTIDFHQSCICERHLCSTSVQLFLNSHEPSKKVILISDMINASYDL